MYGYFLQIQENHLNFDYNPIMLGYDDEIKLYGNYTYTNFGPYVNSIFFFVCLIFVKTTIMILSNFPLSWFFRLGSLSVSFFNWSAPTERLLLIPCEAAKLSKQKMFGLLSRTRKTSFFRCMYVNVKKSSKIGRYQ